MNKPPYPLRRTLLLIAFTGITLGIVLYWEQVVAGLSLFSHVLRPIITAIVIAFLLNLPMRMIENRLLKLFKKEPSARTKMICRIVSLLLSLILFAGIVVILISLLVPQLKASITLLISNLPAYRDNILTWSAQYFPDLNIGQIITDLYSQLNSIIPDMFSRLAPHLYSFTASFASALTDSVMALILSFYLLVAKNTLIRQFEKVMTTYIPKQAEKILPILAMLNTTFRRFFGGQMTEAVILGLLCLVGMSLLGIPYAPLVSTLIAVTAIIPVFGAYIGVIISGFIILMDNPLQALVFVIFLTAMQQIENTFIYPRVVGDSIGLSGLWVLLAVIIGGGMFGIGGIFIGIPVMSVLYTLIQRDVHRRRGEIEPPKLWQK